MSEFEKCKEELANKEKFSILTGMFFRSLTSMFGVNLK